MAIDWGRIGLAVGTGGITEGSRALSGSDDKRKALEDAQWQAADERKRSKAAQLAYVDQLQGPTVSDATSRRIAALESESRDRALAEDPLYQGQRSQLLSGGQQLQSGIENKDIGYGVRGGFSNIGSTADVQDRLGAQLATLAGQAQATRERKRDASAELQQKIQDAKTAFTNSQIQARAAIEAGDSQGALMAIQNGYAAQAAISEAERQMNASLIGAAGTIAGGMIGGPTGAVVGNQVGQSAMGGGGSNASLGADTNYGSAQNFDTGSTGASFSDIPNSARLKYGRR